MAGIYIYSDKVSITKQLITAGLELKETLGGALVVITTDASDVESLSGAGAEKIVVLSGESGWAEGYAPGIASVITAGQASVVLMGGTTRGKDIAAKVAARLKAGLVTDAQTVSFSDGKIQTTRMTYGGLALCTEKLELPAIVTIPPRTFEEASAGGSAEVVNLDSAVDNKVVISDIAPIVREGVDITKADRIVSVGRGLAKKEDLAMAKGLAGVLKAEMACSRSIAEDYHWMPVENYVGISGQKVKPELYFAMGISGQIQHIAGLRDSKIIVAIDTNEKAPIFEAADYGIVGDMYEVVPMLVSALK